MPVVGVRIEVAIEARTQEALAAMSYCLLTLERIIDEQPWNDDAKDALAALETMRRNLTRFKGTPRGE